MLARYAAICQAQGMVPIAEPEVLMDGDHCIERCAVVNEQVLQRVFHALHLHGVRLEHMILKPSMVLPGKQSGKAPAGQIAEATLAVLIRTVPAAVPSINLLSGGQSPQEALLKRARLNSLARRGQCEVSMEV